MDRDAPFRIMDTSPPAGRAYLIGSGAKQDLSDYFVSYIVGNFNSFSGTQVGRINDSGAHP